MSTRHIAPAQPAAGSLGYRRRRRSTRRHARRTRGRGARPGGCAERVTRCSEHARSVTSQPVTARLRWWSTTSRPWSRSLHAASASTGPRKTPSSASTWSVPDTTSGSRRPSHGPGTSTALRSATRGTRLDERFIRRRSAATYSDAACRSSCRLNRPGSAASVDMKIDRHWPPVGCRARRTNTCSLPTPIAPSVVRRTSRGQLRERRCIALITDEREHLACLPAPRRGEPPSRILWRRPAPRAPRRRPGSGTPGRS